MEERVTTWTNKQWGALIGGLVVFLIALIGPGATAFVVIFAILGYFIGKFLDGELDLEDIRDRAQGRRSETRPPETRPPETRPPETRLR